MIQEKRVVTTRFSRSNTSMLLERSRHLHRLEDLLTRHPIVGLLGARQVGKTTLARQLVASGEVPRCR